MKPDGPRALWASSAPKVTPSTDKGKKLRQQAIFDSLWGIPGGWHRLDLAILRSVFQQAIIYVEHYIYVYCPCPPERHGGRFTAGQRAGGSPFYSPSRKILSEYEKICRVKKDLLHWLACKSRISLPLCACTANTQRNSNGP